MAKPRTKRPTRAQLEALLVEHGANITRVARALGVTRPTAYTWLYQLDLADRAGVRAMPPPLPAERVSCTVKMRAELWRWARIEAVMFDCPGIRRRGGGAGGAPGAARSRGGR